MKKVVLSNSCFSYLKKIKSSFNEDIERLKRIVSLHKDKLNRGWGFSSKSDYFRRKTKKQLDKKLKKLINDPTHKGWGLPHGVVT